MKRYSVLALLLLSMVAVGSTFAEEAKLLRTIDSEYFMIDIAWSPDGKTIATTGKLGRRWGVVLRDAATGDVIRFGDVGEAPLYSVAFSPDGSLVAVAGGYNAAGVIWDVASGEERVKLPRGEEHGIANRVAFSPDGKRIATSFQQPGHVVFWDAATGERLGAIGGGSHFAFSPDGRWVANGMQSKNIHLHDAKTLIESTPHIESDMHVSIALAFTPDSETLIVGGITDDENDNAIKLWDVDMRAKVVDLKGSKSRTVDLEIASDDRTLAAVDADRKVMLWTCPPESYWAHSATTFERVISHPMVSRL